MATLLVTLSIATKWIITFEVPLHSHIELSSTSISIAGGFERIQLLA